MLQQGRSYDEIAALLGMPVDAVRARAQAGLAALARDDGLPPEVTGPVADYLLGQQAGGDAEATRGLLAESEPARAWARDVAARLEGVAPGRLAEIPEARDSSATRDEPSVGTGIEGKDPIAVAPPGRAPGRGRVRPRSRRAGARRRAARGLAARRRAADRRRPRGRRRGAVPRSPRGGDDSGDEAAAGPTATATATATPSAAPAEAAETIRLRPPAGGDATGTMSLFLQQGQLLFALEAQNVPPSGANAAYAVWFTGPGAKARRLGFTNPVGDDGQLGIQGPSDKDLAAFPQLYATYERVVVSEETNENAKRPGKVILAGRLPQGR